MSAAKSLLIELGTEELPVKALPVTRFTASGLQYVRTSENICEVLVSKWPNSMATPFKLSFSVANT